MKHGVLIDYMDVLKSPSLTEEQKVALNLQAQMIKKACKGRGIMIVDRKATRKNKKVIWKEV